MTKPQLWIAAFLVLFVILFLLGRITKENYTMKNAPQRSTLSQTNNNTNSPSTKNLNGK